MLTRSRISVFSYPGTKLKSHIPRIFLLRRFRSLTDTWTESKVSGWDRSSFPIAFNDFIHHALDCQNLIAAVGVCNVEMKS